MNTELETKFFSKTSKSLQVTPGFEESRFERRQEVRHINSGTHSIFALRILVILVGEVERLSNAFDGLVRMGT